MAIWRMRIACWVPKATNTNSLYGMLLAFPLQYLLQNLASLLSYAYFACLVVSCNVPFFAIGQIKADILMLFIRMC
jgi:hypothetical protein